MTVEVELFPMLFVTFIVCFVGERVYNYYHRVQQQKQEVEEAKLVLHVLDRTINTGLNAARTVQEAVKLDVLHQGVSELNNISSNLRTFVNENHKMMQDFVKK